MSLGAGIFLSVLVVCLLVLFLQTKDRWRWPKIVVWSVGLIVGLISVCVGGFWTYNTYQNWPVRQTEYHNIQLGASKEEVLYLLGQPTGVYRDPTEEEKKSDPIWSQGFMMLDNPGGKYREGKSAKDYDYCERDEQPTFPFLTEAARYAPFIDRSGTEWLEIVLMPCLKSWMKPGMTGSTGG